MAIAGKSGSGKTTLLKCIYGLVDLQGGDILFDNQKVLGPSWQLIPGNENMSLVSQDYYVLDNHTVIENITDKLIGYTDAYKEKRVKALVNLLELGAIKNMRAKQLSSGQKQRVAIARALAIMPRLLLLDEPFSNLDHLLSMKLFAFVMREAKRNNSAVILVTHQGEEALKYAEYIAIVDAGKLVQFDTAKNVYYKPKNLKLAGLLGEYSILHQQDFEKHIAKKKPKKLIVRPDKLQICSASHAELLVTIEACSFNGKCYEILVSSLSGRTLLLYSSNELSIGKKCYCRIVP